MFYRMDTGTNQTGMPWPMEGASSPETIMKGPLPVKAGRVNSWSHLSALLSQVPACYSRLCLIGYRP